MLKKLIAFYSRNNRNQQFYEYVTIFLVVIQIAIVGNLAAILDNHPIPIFDIVLTSALISFAALPIFAAQRLWKINKAARFFLSAEPRRVSARARTGRFESVLLTELEAAAKISSQKDILSLLNIKIDGYIRKYTAISFLYMIPFFIIILAWLTIILNYHDSFFELLQKESSGQWSRRAKLSELHSSKTNLMSNLIWATVALQIASGLAIKAAYGDLRNAVEDCLTGTPIESGPAAISSPASP